MKVWMAITGMMTLIFLIVCQIVLLCRDTDNTFIFMCPGLVWLILRLLPEVDK